MVTFLSMKKVTIRDPRATRTLSIRSLYYIRSMNLYPQKLRTFARFLILLCAWCASCNHPAPAQTSKLEIIKPVILGDTTSTLSNNIMIIYQDQHDNYWFGSWEDGVYRYDGKQIIHFTTKHGLPSNRIDEIREDQQGRLFFNTSEGVSRFDGHSLTTLPVLDKAKSKWNLDPDDLWFKCTGDSGLVYRYDGQVLHRLTFPPTQIGEKYIADHPAARYPNMRHSPYGVYTVYKDSHGNIWFGTSTLGVCRYDGNAVQWISEPDVNEIHDGPANGVRSVVEDKDGYFWFNAMYRYQVYGLDDAESRKSTNEILDYHRIESIGSLDGAPDGNITEYLSSTRDSNNNLWFVTYTNGVWRYDGKEITHYEVKNGRSSITLFYIYKDNHGDLWLGTHENGVYKLDGKEFKRFMP